MYFFLFMHPHGSILLLFPVPEGWIQIGTADAHASDQATRSSIVAVAAAIYSSIYLLRVSCTIECALQVGSAQPPVNITFVDQVSSVVSTRKAVEFLTIFFK